MQLAAAAVLYRVVAHALPPSPYLNHLACPQLSLAALDVFFLVPFGQLNLLPVDTHQVQEVSIMHRPCDHAAMQDAWIYRQELNLPHASTQPDIPQPGTLSDP
jgi:hypothetical protein